MQGLPSVLSLFRSEFNKFNSTGARMLDSIYHMTFIIIFKSYFCVKTLGFCHMRDVIAFPENFLTTSGLSIYCIVFFPLPDATSYDKNVYSINTKTLIIWLILLPYILKYLALKYNQNKVYL